MTALPAPTIDATPMDATPMDTNPVDAVRAVVAAPSDAVTVTVRRVPTFAEVTTWVRCVAPAIALPFAFHW